MSRSYKKYCAGTNCVCKSQKKGKKICHRKFRRNGTLIKMREAVDQWNLGGDGKRVYSWHPKEDGLEKYLRK